MYPIIASNQSGLVHFPWFDYTLGHKVRTQIRLSRLTGWNGSHTCDFWDLYYNLTKCRGYKKWCIKKSILGSTLNAFAVVCWLFLKFNCLKKNLLGTLSSVKSWAVTWDFQQCGMCDQQRLRQACAYAQSDQSLCWSLDILWILSYWLNII